MPTGLGVDGCDVIGHRLRFNRVERLKNCLSLRKKTASRLNDLFTLLQTQLNGIHALLILFPANMDLGAITAQIREALRSRQQKSAGELRAQHRRSQGRSFQNIQIAQQRCRFLNGPQANALGDLDRRIDRILHVRYDPRLKEPEISLEQRQFAHVILPDGRHSIIL